MKNEFVVHIEGDVFSDDSEYAKVKEAVLLGKGKKDYKTLLKKCKGNLAEALNDK